MADTIIPNVVVSMPSQLFTLARSFKAAANGRIYIGKIDTDPTIPENQIQVYLENEDGTHVPIAQPIIINSGGYPVYGGQIAKFVTVQGHSMAVYDAFGAQQFYFNNVLGYDPDQFRPDFEAFVSGLASPAGPKYVGRCPDVATLRTIEPTLPDQKVDLVRYASGYAGGGSEIYYDPNDTTTSDDGVMTFVTPGGARWKRPNTGEIPLEWAGYNPSTSNAAAALQKIINLIVAIAVRTKSFADLPEIIIKKGRYTMTTTVKHAPFITIKSQGNVIFSFAGSDLIGFNVTNVWDGLQNTDVSFQASSGAYFLDGSGGMINIIGIGAASSSQGGIQLGNSITGYPNFREAKMRNVLVTGFIAGTRWKTVDTYLCTIYDSRFERNKHGLLVDDTTARNSGEKISFIKCVFGDCSDNTINHNASGINFDFVSCSFDFTPNHIVAFRPSGAYSDLSFIGGHIEAFGGALVRQDSQIAGAGPNRVLFSGTTILCRKNINNYNSVRQIFGANSPVYVNIDNSHLIFEKTNSEVSGTLVAAADGTTTNNARVKIRSHIDKPEYLPTYRDSLTAWILSGTSGMDITTTGDTSIGLSFLSTGSATVSYLLLGGEIVLEINCPTVTSSIRMYMTTPVSVGRGDIIYSMCSVRPGSSTGNLNVSGLIRGYGRQTSNANHDVIENFTLETADTTVDMLPYFTAEGIPNPGPFQFISTPPLAGKADYKAFYCYPGLRFTGFTGKVQVKLPAWWFKSR
ncbi:TPA: phage tailspike protein [Serratia marcescens]